MAKRKSFFKTWFKKIKTAAGFTLIELLVVIGILGILATALVATIDPFEQLNKASDANVKNAAVEFNTASIRYFTTHNAFPWDTTANGGEECNSGAGADFPASVQLSAWVSGGASGECLADLISDGEIKSGFETSDALTELYVSAKSSTDNSPIVCFMPKSKAEQNSDATRYNRDGTVNTTKDCSSSSETNGCYWCSQ